MVKDRIGPLGAFAEYIEKAIPRVAATTGVDFPQAYRELIQKRDEIQDSRLPAAIFSLIAEKQASSAVEIAHEIQQLHFEQGLSLSRPESYVSICKKYAVNPPWQDSAEITQLAEAQFLKASQMDIDAFPALVYGSTKGDFFPLCHGFQPYENLAHALETLHRDPPDL